MELDVDMLHLCMKGGVFGEYNGTLIVAEDVRLRSEFIWKHRE